jgi:hypothetical protein
LQSGQSIRSEGIAFKLGQARDRLDAAAIGLHREHQAGPDRQAVDDHSAGTAYTLAAGEMDTGATGVIAQEIAQEMSRTYGRGDEPAVDRHCQR